MRSILLVMAYGVIPLATTSTALPTQYLPIWGGGGGSGFTRSCGDGRVLTGLQYRAGLVMDAVGVLCRPVQADGKLGLETTVGSLAGGGNGTPDSRSCASGHVVGSAEIIYGSFVNAIRLYCHPWSASGRTFGTNPQFMIARGSSLSGGTLKGNVCGANTQPAIGIRGRASALVDAIGFFCDEP